MKRRWLLTTLIGFTMLLVVTLAVLVQNPGSAPEYSFLKGAQAVLVEKARYADSTIVVMRVFNVHRPWASVTKEMDAELAANGWGAQFGQPCQTSWTPSSGVRTTKGVFDFGYVVATDGQTRLARGTAQKGGVDRHHTIEGWTAIVMVENYRPNWAQKLLDHLSPQPKPFSFSVVQLTPSKAYRDSHFHP